MRPTVIWLCGVSLAGVPLAVTAAPAANHQQHEHRGHDHGTPPRAAANGWTTHPLILPVTGARSADRASATLSVEHLDAAMLDVVSPDASAAVAHFPLTGARASVRPAAAGAGNYQWVMARSDAGAQTIVASSVYFFSNPGPAPGALLLKPKSELEIIPQPLPREHANYRESESWRFLVRFNGQALANARVQFESEYGSRATYVSDAQGIISVTFPRDFPARPTAVESGHHMGPPRARFVLAVEHGDHGRRYLTAFNYVYSPHADRGKNLWAGIGFGLFGMLLATPLLRRRKSDTADAR